MGHAHPGARLERARGRPTRRSGRGRRDVHLGRRASAGDIQCRLRRRRRASSRSGRGGPRRMAGRRQRGGRSTRVWHAGCRLSAGVGGNRAVPIAVLSRGRPRGQ